MQWLEYLIFLHYVVVSGKNEKPTVFLANTILNQVKKEPFFRTLPDETRSVSEIR